MSLKTVTTFILATAFAAGTAQASEMTVNAKYGDDEVPVAYVKTKGIDLSTAEGVAKVRSMVRWAAKSMCESSGRVSLHQMGLEETCTKTAIASAEPQIARAIASFTQRDRLAGVSIKLNGR
jgi:UrcA family protein